MYEFLKISRYVRQFSRDAYTVLFHSVNMNRVYGTKLLREIFNIFKSAVKVTDVEHLLQKSSIDLLISKGILVDASDDESHFFSELRKQTSIVDITNAVFLVSTKCNHVCSYCQIKQNMERENMLNMSSDVAHSAFDLFKSNNRSHSRSTITITGGEPLLNYDIVRLLIDRARHELDSARIVIFTNGSLVSKEIAQYFKDNDVLVIVSIDGPREMHDRVRRFENGKGSFDSDLQGYQVLREIGCNVGISAVGGKHNIDDIEALRDFFVSISPSSIGFNFSHLLINKDNPTEIPISLCGDILIELYKAFREKRIYLENISRTAEAFANNRPRIRECQAHGSGFTVDSRGMIGPCKSLLVSNVFAKDIGTVDKIGDDQLFRDWAHRSPIWEKDCQFCAALSICGGGCAYDSYIINNGDFKRVDKRVCEYHLNMLSFLLWDLFEKVKDKLTLNKIYFPTIEEQYDAVFTYFDTNNRLQKSVGH